MISHHARAHRDARTPVRLLAATGLGVCVALLGSACGAPLPELRPGQSPAAYSGLEVTGDRVEYAIGKVPGIVEEELEASGVPGAAVAVVHAGEVVLAEGFGVRSTDTGEAVDTRTVFPLGSLSTPVSATVVAAESAEGEADWSTPVRRYLPWFALSDERTSQEVTVGDLFAHRSGLPEHAGEDPAELGYDRAAVLHGLRHLPLGPFRTSYGATDFGVTAGAEAVAVSAGTPWAELARQRVLDPLGMSDSSYSHAELAERDNRAVDHVRADGAGSGAAEGESEPTSVAGWIPADAARDTDVRAPAGGMSSSVADMARWMSMVLAEGTGPDGGRIVPADALREALTPQVVSSPPQSAAERAGTYGFGFEISTTSSGRVQWSHSGGSADGSASAMLMIPSLEVGIVTLTNAAPVGVPETINARFADYAQYGDPAIGWRELFTEEFDSLTAPVGDLVDARRPASPEPAPETNELLGVYRNDYLGEIEIRERSRAGGGSGEDDDDTGPALELVVGPDPQTWPLEHWDGPVFAASPRGGSWPPGSRGSVTFRGDTVTVELLDANGLGTFTRVGD